MNENTTMPPLSWRWLAIGTLAVIAATLLALTLQIESSEDAEPRPGPTTLRVDSLTPEERTRLAQLTAETAAKVGRLGEGVLSEEEVAETRQQIAELRVLYAAAGGEGVPTE